MCHAAALPTSLAYALAASAAASPFLNNDPALLPATPLDWAPILGSWGADLALSMVHDTLRPLY
jgi:hypothetical protein